VCCKGICFFLVVETLFLGFCLFFFGFGVETHSMRLYFFGFVVETHSMRLYFFGSGVETHSMRLYLLGDKKSCFPLGKQL